MTNEPWEGFNRIGGGRQDAGALFVGLRVYQRVCPCSGECLVYFVARLGEKRRDTARLLLLLEQLENTLDQGAT